MTVPDSYIIIGIGVLFLLLGLIIMLWARQRHKTRGDILSRDSELRNFLGYWPELVDPGALRIGGWLFLALGIAVLAIGIYLIV